MAQTVVASDLYVNGQLAARTMSIPNGAVDNTAVEAAAGIEASKLEHRFQIVYCQDQIAYADQRVVHVVHGATGDIIAFKAGSVGVCTSSATMTVDLLVNGSSVLSSAIVLDSSNTTRVVEAATVSSTALVVGDVLEVSVAVSGTTLGNGLFAVVVMNEDYI